MAEVRDRGRGLGEVGDPVPAVAGARRPAGALEAQERHAAAVAQACAPRPRSARRTGGWRRRRRRSRARRASAASASGPPNPPMRTSPAGSRGAATRPASEVSHGDALGGERRPPACGPRPCRPSTRTGLTVDSGTHGAAGLPAPGCARLDHGRVRDRRDHRRLHGAAHRRVPGPGDDRPARREAARLRARGASALEPGPPRPAWSRTPATTPTSPTARSSSRPCGRRARRGVVFRAGPASARSPARPAAAGRRAGHQPGAAADDARAAVAPARRTAT